MSLWLNALPVNAQMRRAQQPSTSPARRQPPTAATRAAKAQGAPTLLKPNEANNAMAVAYTSGQLPAPAAMPPGNIDEVAAALAKQLTARDEESVSALLMAMQIAGFSVRAPDNQIMLEAIKPGQGLAIPAGRVAAMSKLYGDGLTVRLADLSAAFTENLPAFKGAPFAAMLVDGLAKNAEGNNPPLRFWARFIVELGRQRARPYDLLNRNLQPGSVELDAIQMMLILTRLSADLVVTDKPNAALKSSLTKTPQPKARFINADYLPTDFNSSSHAVAVVPATFTAMQGASLPCTVDDTAGMIMDTSAAGTGFGFGQLMNYLERKGVSGAGKLGGLTGSANIALNLVKLYATMAALEVDIQMDAKELVRTKNTSPGARQQLTAHARMNIGKWQMVNCLRPALNTAGVDFSLPNDGDLGDVAVEWQLEEGGDCRGWIGTVQDFGKILSGNASYGDGSIVFFDAVPGTDRSPAKQTTDENGFSHINLVGTPQKEDLSNKKVTAVSKQAKVKALITLSRIKDKASLYSPLLASAGITISGLTGDYMGAGAGLITEMLNRSNSLFYGTYAAPVKDWEACDDYELEYDSSFTNGFPGGGYFYHVRSKVKFNRCDDVGKLAPLEYVKFTASGNPGEAAFGKVENNIHGLTQTLVSGTIAAVGTKPDNISVLKIEFDQDAEQASETNCQKQNEAQQKQALETVAIVLDVGNPQEVVRTTSALTGASEDTPESGWADDWRRGHGRERYDPDLKARDELAKQLMENANNSQKVKELMAKPENQRLIEEMNSDMSKSSVYKIKLKQVSPGVWRTNYNVPDKGLLSGYSLSEVSFVTLRRVSP